MKVKGRRQSEYAVPTSTWDDIIAGIMSKMPGAVSLEEFPDVVDQDTLPSIPLGHKGEFGKFRRSMDERFRREKAQRKLHIQTGNPNMYDPLNNVNSRSRMDSVPDRELWRSQDRPGHRYPDVEEFEYNDYHGDEHGDIEDLERGEGPLRGRDVVPPKETPKEPETEVPEGIPTSMLMPNEPSRPANKKSRAEQQEEQERGKHGPFSIPPREVYPHPNDEQYDGSIITALMGSGYSNKPVPDDPWSDEPGYPWRRAGDNPNQAKDDMLKAWMDWYSHGRQQVDREIHTLPADELEQWRINDLKQLDEMERRFQYSPRRYSR